MRKEAGDKHVANTRIVWQRVEVRRFIPRARPAWASAIGGLVMAVAFASPLRADEPVSNDGSAGAEGGQADQPDIETAESGTLGEAEETGGNKDGCASEDAAAERDKPEPVEVGRRADSVGEQLKEDAEKVDSITKRGPITSAGNAWTRWVEGVKKSIGLDLGLSYTAVYQNASSTVGGPRDAASGDLDLFGRWQPKVDENAWPGALYFNVESRHRFTDIAPADLDTGTIGGTIEAFDAAGFSVVELYWEQSLSGDRMAFVIGKMNPGLLWDAGRYVSSNYSFLSPSFSDTLPMALPAPGLGVAALIEPTDFIYIAAGIHDANGQRNTIGFDTAINDREFFTTVEFGWTPKAKQRTSGRYSITLWHTDSRQRAGTSSDIGLAMTLEQPLGTEGKFVPFLRYAVSERGLNGIRENLAVGLGIENVLRRSHDLIGVGVNWMDPSDRELLDQYAFELFYRFHISPRLHLTPDVQVIKDPANAPDQDTVVVIGLRLRTLF